MIGMPPAGGCGAGGMTAGAGRIADQIGSPRPSRGISAMVPARLVRTYSGDGAQAETSSARASTVAVMNLVRAMLGAACYTPPI